MRMVLKPEANECFSRFLGGLVVFISSWEYFLSGSGVQLSGEHENTSIKS